MLRYEVVQITRYPSSACGLQIGLLLCQVSSCATHLYFALIISLSGPVTGPECFVLFVAMPIIKVPSGTLGFYSVSLSLPLWKLSLCTAAIAKVRRERRTYIEYLSLLAQVSILYTYIAKPSFDASRCHRGLSKPNNTTGDLERGELEAGELEAQAGGRAVRPSGRQARTRSKTSRSCRRISHSTY